MDEEQKVLEIKEKNHNKEVVGVDPKYENFIYTTIQN